jgi:RHS repeat-associated protein
MIASATDLNSQPTSFNYDGLNRLTSNNFPDNGQTTYCYSDFTGSCYSSTLPPYEITTIKMTSSANFISTTQVDGLSRTAQTQIKSDTEGTDFTDTTYDALGRVATVSNPHRNGSLSTDGVTAYRYDPLGRVCVIIPPDGTTPSGTTCPTTAPTNDIFKTYSGNCATVTDQAGRARRTCSDALGRVVSASEDPGGLNYLTSYGYDALNNLTSVLQAGSRQRTFTYNSLSQLLTATNPESGTITYTYDNDGNVLTKTDARNVMTTYTYDSLNRLTNKSYSDGTPVARFYFDSGFVPGGATPQNTIGRLVTAQTPITDSAFSYDKMGRVLWNVQATPLNCCSTGWTLNYSYDLMGNMTSFSNGVGTTFSYTYDGAARPTTLTSSLVDAQHPAAIFTTDATNGYFPNGALRKAAFGNGLTQSNLYDKRLQPCRLDVANSSAMLLLTCNDPTPTGNVLDLSMNYNLGVSDNGNVSGWNATGAQSFARTYTYDTLNRVQTMADSATSQSCKGLSWTDDPWGNRTDQNLTLGTCGQFHATADAQNRLHDTSNFYQYDAAGNMTHDASHSYTYDAENRITAVDAGNTANYYYDAQGYRVHHLVGTTMEYLYDLQGRVVSEFLPSGGLNAYYMYFGGSFVAEYESLTTYFVHHDHLGSTRLLTNYPSPTPLRECDDYYPYGELISCGDTSGTTHKFTAKERDSESGLDNFGARYFGSSLGRFMRPDPSNVSGDIVDSENPQAWNMYSYVLNNPLDAVDPDGLDYNLLGGDRCLQDVECDKQGYVLDKKGNRVVVTDQQINGSNGLAKIDVNGNLQINTAQGTFQGQFFDPNIGANGAAIIPQAIVTPSYEEQKFMALQDAGAMATPGVNAALAITSPQLIFMGGATVALSGAGSTLTLEAGEIAASPGEVAELSQAVTQGGRAAVKKALRSFAKRLAQHQADLARYQAQGGYTSSTMSEIKHFETMIRLAEEYLIKNP